MSIGKRKTKDSLKFRIILLLLISISVIMTAVLFSGFMIIKYNRTQYDRQLGQKFSELQNEFFQKSYSIQSIMTAFKYDQNIQRVLGETNASAYEIVAPIYDMEQNILKLLYSYSLLNHDIYDIHLINEWGNRYVYLSYSDSNQIDSFIEQNQNCTDTVISDVFILGGEQCFAIMQPIRDTSNDFAYTELPENIIGHIIVTVDGRFLKERIEALSSGSGYAFLLDRNGHIMITSDRVAEINTSVMKEISSKIACQVDGTVDQLNEYVITKSRFNDIGWSIVFVSKNINRDFYDMYPFVFLGVGWLPVLCIISYIVFRLMKNINSFINKVLQHMDNIGKGDWENKIESDEIEEFKRIDDGLNEMMEKVVVLSDQNVRLSTEIYKKEKDQIQNTLLALQSQMNPHFLYNTMECIKNIGICYGVSEIQSLSGALADILKYSLRRDQVVTVREELACINNFMEIQSIRFEERYRIIYNVDDALIGLKIMRLSLEPLVENAVKHGFEKIKTNCVIEINIYQDGDHYNMDIKDNGQGMSPDILQNIMKYDENTGEGVALKNLFRRLEIFYQDNVKFQINSRENEGTTVSIMIDKDFYRD